MEPYLVFDASNDNDENNQKTISDLIEEFKGDGPKVEHRRVTYSRNKLTVKKKQARSIGKSPRNRSP